MRENRARGAQTRVLAALAQTLHRQRHRRVLGRAQLRVFDQIEQRRRNRPRLAARAQKFRDRPRLRDEKFTSVTVSTLRSRPIIRRDSHAMS